MLQIKINEIVGAKKNGNGLLGHVNIYLLKTTLQIQNPTTINVKL